MSGGESACRLYVSRTKCVLESLLTLVKVEHKFLQVWLTERVVGKGGERVGGRYSTR